MFFFFERETSLLKKQNVFSFAFFSFKFLQRSKIKIGNTKCNISIYVSFSFVLSHNFAKSSVNSVL